MSASHEEAKGVVERLREVLRGVIYNQRHADLMEEAASLLTRLVGEVESWKQTARSHDEDANLLARQCNMLSDRARAAEAERDRLRGALEEIAEHRFPVVGGAPAFARTALSALGEPTP